jgi:hypothetical protein
MKFFSKSGLKTLKWIAIIGAGCLAILLIINWIWIARTDYLLEQKLTEIRELGQPVTLEELIGPPVPDDQNATTYLLQAEAPLDAISKIVDPISINPLNQHLRFLPDKLAEVKNAFTQNPDAIDLIEKAADCEFFQIDYLSDRHDTRSYKRKQKRPIENKIYVVMEKNISWVGVKKKVARFLTCRAELFLEEGKPDEAVKTCMIGLRLFDYRSKPSWIMSSFVDMGSRGRMLGEINKIIQKSKVSPDILLQLDEQLARIDYPSIVEQTLQGERVFGLENVNEFKPPRLWPIWGYWNQTKIYYLDLMKKRPVPVDRTPSLYTVVDQIIPAIKGFYYAVHRRKAFDRAYRILIAIKRLPPDKLKLFENDPTKTELLGLPKELSVDPYSKPPAAMKIVRTDDGWKVYSVGKNGKDNGGQSYAPRFLSEETFYVSTRKSDDIGVGPVGKPKKPAMN